MKKLKGEAQRKDWEEGRQRCLGCGEKGHLIATCPKVRYAKRVLKLLNLALKEGYKPTGEKQDKEGKPKRHLWASATKVEGSEEDSGPSEAEEEGSSSSVEEGESGNDSHWSD